MASGDGPVTRQDQQHNRIAIAQVDVEAASVGVLACAPRSLVSVRSVRRIAAAVGQSRANVVDAVPGMHAMHSVNIPRSVGY
jgi:hypothetical protein